MIPFPFLMNGTFTKHSVNLALHFSEIHDLILILINQLETKSSWHR